jgi:hypothetical protein
MQIKAERNVLATRVLQYRHDSGEERDVTLTVFEPLETEEGDWECGFQFIPPANQRLINAFGLDYIQALLACLMAARGYIEHPVEHRSSWKGMFHGGLPWTAKKPPTYEPPLIPASEPNPGGMEVLATRTLGRPGEDGSATKLPLTVYKPFRTDDGTWRCAIVLGSAESEPVRYGVGSDFIEALLDGLAMARAVYETMVPNGWNAPGSEELWDGCFLPYKVERSYGMEPSRTSSDASEDPAQ